MIILSAIIGIIVLLEFRWLWIKWKIENYTFVSLYYVHKTRKDVKMVQEMSQLWSKKYMLFDFLCWDFSKYVIHQDYYIDALEFFIKEQDLSEKQFWNELDDVENKISKDNDNIS